MSGITVATIINGRSIPDDQLNAIDGSWGDLIPRISVAIRRLWGMPVRELEATELERSIAQQVHDYTLREGKTLTAEEAKMLVLLRPCMDGEPYGAGEVWVDIPAVAVAMERTEAHVRRMLLDGKLKADVILRPSPGSMAKKRWILNGSWERLTIARKPRDGSGMTADMLKEVLDGAETVLE